MRHFAVILLLFMALPAWGGAAERDDSGKTLFLDRPARRIVSLAPNITELLYAAGAGKSMVGAVEYSDYPPEALKLERVGNAQSLDIEKIASLRPDLVVAWKSGNPPDQLNELHALGVPVFYVDPMRLSAIPTDIEKLGALSGTEDTAKKSAQAFNRRLEVLRNRYSGKKQVSVFYEIWPSPLMTVNDRHIISDVMKLCGAENIFGNLPALVPVVSLGAVIRADPEAIIGSGEGDARPPWLDDWKKWDITASRKNHLFYIPADLINRQSPRLLQGAEMLCRQVDTVRDR